MKTLCNYIGGAWHPPVNKKYLINHSPIQTQALAQIPLSDIEDVELAVQSAKNAFPAWRDLTPKERSTYLYRLADLIEENLEALAELECLDTGKPLWLCQQVDIPRSVDNFRFFAAACTQYASHSHQMGSVGFNYTMRSPLGVVVCIAPWNLPLYLLTWKIAPALAAGNCVIAKPSEVTPMTADFLGKLIEQAGFPAGVINIIHGTGQSVGDPLITHPLVKAISFTGGTQTGKHIALKVAPQLKKISLELGGKNPFIVFDDADLDKVIPMAIKAAFSNQGQICLCGSRFLIQKKIYQDFKNKFVAETKKLIVGDPKNPQTQIGSIVSEPHFIKVLKAIELAKTEGAILLTGGKCIQPENAQNGYYILPTIFEGLNQNCQTNQQEIFGPVVTLDVFEDEKQAIQLANSTAYGLAASVWTKNLNTAHNLSRHLEMGMVWINTWMLRDLRTPFGGVKQSGLGSEGGFHALDFFTENKNICMTY